VTQERATTRRGRPSKYSAATRNQILHLIRSGSSLDDAAREAGVHPASLYRWMNKYPAFDADVQKTVLNRDRLKYFLLGRERSRPRVPWKRECPKCGFDLEVRTAGGMGGFRFYRCSRWPVAGLSSGHILERARPAKRTGVGIGSSCSRISVPKLAKVCLRTVSTSCKLDSKRSNKNLNRA
jgi:hypothetical protein